MFKNATNLGCDTVINRYISSSIINTTKNSQYDCPQYRLRKKKQTGSNQTWLRKWSIFTISEHVMLRYVTCLIEAMAGSFSPLISMETESNIFTGNPINALLNVKR